MINYSNNRPDFGGVLDSITSLFSSSSTISSNVPKTDEEKRNAGITAVKYFHAASLQYSPYTFKSNDELVAYFDRLSPSFLKNYGNAILAANFNQADLKDINEALAEKVQGKVPPNSAEMQVFFTVLSEDVTSVSTALWKGVESSVVQAKTAAAVAGTVIAGFAAYKVVALAVAGLTAAASIYVVYKSSKNKKKK